MMARRSLGRKLGEGSAVKRTRHVGDTGKRLRVFISYSYKDRTRVMRIIDSLSELGCEIWIDQDNLKPGDDIKNVTFAAISDADVFILVVSENSLRSQWVQAESSAAIVNKQISGRLKKIIPIKLDGASVPSLVSQYLYIDFHADFEAGLNRLRVAIAEISADNRPAEDEIATAVQTRELHEQALGEALRRGKLTLVCGAGISIAAGVPSWNNLLARLLDKMLQGLSTAHSISLNSETTAAVQLELGKSSSLILGKYLKNNLRDDFEKEVRASLYSSMVDGSRLIHSIANLARPQREAKPLESIITFNFDDIIETALDTAAVPHKSIFSELINHDAHQIPIYHVHGYLPRSGEIPETELVFSEDAYHSQFIDPFSWSNMMQLNKLSTMTCLFVGISLTDPNMRRLLDVAWRKNPGKTKSHYIVKKRPSLRGEVAARDIAEILEEQDANLLGLNVLWIEEFDDLSGLIDRIAKFED